MTYIHYTARAIGHLRQLWEDKCTIKTIRGIMVRKIKMTAAYVLFAKS
jgi:hypothetical protein